LNNWGGFSLRVFIVACLRKVTGLVKNLGLFVRASPAQECPKKNSGLYFVIEIEYFLIFKMEVIVCR
jgi:hypothetical protein